MSTVEEYLAGFDGEVRERLDTLRATLHDAVPGAAEKISYGVPTLTVNGRNVVHFAGYAGHTAVYPVPEATGAVAELIARYRAGKGTLRFPHTEPLPVDLVGEVGRLLAERAR